MLGAEPERERVSCCLRSVPCRGARLIIDMYLLMRAVLVKKLGFPQELSHACVCSFVFTCWLLSVSGEVAQLAHSSDLPPFLLRETCTGKPLCWQTGS